MGYKYEPPAIVKIDTHPNKQTLLVAIYFLIGDFATLFSFFREFFQADQGRLTFERLGLLVSLRLPSKSELLASGRIVVASFRSIQNLPNLSKL